MMIHSPGHTVGDMSVTSYHQIGRRIPSHEGREGLEWVLYEKSEQHIYRAEGRVTHHSWSQSSVECNDTGLSGIKDSVGPGINVPDQSSLGDVVDMGIDAKICPAVDVEKVQGDED